MKKIRGVIVYPSNIEQIVHKYPEVAEFFIHIVREKGLDQIIVDIEPVAQLQQEKIPELIEKLKEDLRVGIGIRIVLKVAAPDSLPRWDHKAKRFVDERDEVPF